MNTNQEVTMEQAQLSFEVGGGPAPDKAVVKLSGNIRLEQELKKGAEVHLRVVDADGELVADAYGRVTTVSFKDIRDKDGDVIGVERGHTVKLGG